MTHSEEFRRLVFHHLDSNDECRWCFAVDLERVRGNLVALYEFPDCWLEHWRCPRCGEDFTYYCRYFCALPEGESIKENDDYLKQIINKLHPELGGQIDAKLLNEVRERVLYPDDLEDYVPRWDTSTNHTG